MTDDELVMAYADGELGMIEAKRFEKRIAEVPELAAAVEAHLALRATLEQGFAPLVDEPVPERLVALLQNHVADLPGLSPIAAWWRTATAMAACLIGGIAIGHFAQTPGVSGKQLVAAGALASALDEQLAGGSGSTRILVSFRDTQGHYCRVFQGAAFDGIACRDQAGWSLRRMQASEQASASDYRQAGSTAPDILAAAQGMMAGDPLDAADERTARAQGWRR